MKNINYRLIIILLSLGMLGTSCESYLEEENNSFLSIENASSKPETFNQLVATVYQRSRESSTRYTSNLYYALEDLGTDIVTRGTSISGIDDVNDYVNFTPLNWAVGVYWSNQYGIISAANIAIDNADLIQGVDANTKSIGIGEAKFFRAMSYFNLVENYGGVPLVLNQISNADTDYSRASEEAVYTQILQDLDDALTNVPSSVSEYGRVTKDAVRHLRSKVLLTRGYKTFAGATDFKDAAVLAESVITNHPLVPSFSNLVSIDNQRNSEVVFSYLFGNSSVSRGWGNSRHMLYKFRFFDYPGLSRTVKGLGPMPTPFYYSLFDDADERADATFTREIYATEDYTGKNGEAMSAGELAIFFPKTVWTQAEIDAVPYAVINPGTYFDSDGITIVQYPQFTKFDDPGVPFTQPDQSSQGERDMVIMRSGEAYLIAAEARFKASEISTAAAHLTTLRSRAGLTTAVTNAEVTLDFILDERARELTGEVNRWMDLKRTGKLIERTLMHNPHAALNNALKSKHLLRPIPQKEIDLTSGSITQNPDYN
ncbi:RagB/SusD family nutrient uptake outer membrane protein [Polaribacter reichenbachii]|uniref:Glycan metabolism protein RagB n=1 Tax=Polaribacter reichenbachii TaxID=996801 RepID=A0A1B8U1P0_9FLAO|nr:RagB/SusD family nutrient uptake outer membrane protein [Polaribacter reichenbachii]APZ47333.1 RagB/SusD family nutrient uptake outer membrane protein [Polaribacter reichenbachii]AUC17974.1 RagB/SusD family nutrient uptake outer membrane protein [Polaribacter reichenbachii]OBY65699.1 glycan metabolism protein RagB [Polaribacter reichenbachii]